MRIRAGVFIAAVVAAASGAVAQDSGLRPTFGDDGDPFAADLPPPLRRTAPEADPYAALGIRAGGFLLFPSLTGTIGYSTNAAGVAGGGGSATATVAPELLIESDWARHAASLRLRGSYEKVFDGTPDRPEGSADAAGRLDFADGWQGDLSGRYDYRRQTISDPDFPAGADSPPGVHHLAGTAGVMGHAGRAKLTVAGSVDRWLYEDAASGGVPIDQGDRDNTVFSARVRAGDEVGGTLTPFVEGEIARRAYDRVLDNDGLRRSATGYGWRVGLEIDRDPLLAGEIAIGMAHETFDDASLAALSALTVDGSLVWSPTTLTTVRLDGSTELRPSTNPASSGAVVYDGAVDIAYAWRRNFTVNWTAGVSHERFQGTDAIETTYRAGVAATWKLNRTAHLTAGYVHEWLASSTPGAGYESDAVRMELRLQR